MLDKLQTKFLHPKWFKEGITKKEALTYFANSPDFYLVYENQFPKGETRLLVEPIKVPYLRYAGKERGTYKLTPVELAFYLQIKEELKIDRNI